MNTKLLNITVKDPKSVTFSGTALAVSSRNTGGKFDILPYHSNFISLIREAVIIHQENKKQITIPLQNGIIKVHNDTVKILIGVETKS